MPKLFIIAGSNGAGKTTFAKEFLPHYAHCPNFINADLIAMGLSPFSPDAVNIKAGRLLLSQIREFVSKKEDFAFETTFAGKSYLPLIKKIKDAGYAIHVFFLWIPDVKLSLERIKQRVKAGGHNVPSKDVKRRFARSHKNFMNFYKPLCDSWIIFDNSSGRPVEIAKQVKTKLKVFNKILYRHFTKGRI